MLGACVRRARLQAADGAPMPTKHTSELLSARAATMVIISLGAHVEGAAIWADMGEPSAFVLLFVSLGEHAHAAGRDDGSCEPRLRPVVDLRLARHADDIQGGAHCVRIGRLDAQALQREPEV